MLVHFRQVLERARDQIKILALSPFHLLAKTLQTLTFAGNVMLTVVEQVFQLK